MGWETRSLRAVYRLLSPHPSSSFDPHISEVAPVESNAEVVVEMPIGDETTKNQLAVCDLNPQSYTGQIVWLAIFRNDDVKASYAPFSRLMKTM